MKNARLFSVLTLVSLLVVSCSTTSTLVAPNTKGLSFEEAVNVLNTPEKINAWFSKHMTWYRSGNTFRSPREIFESKRGSCIRYANLAAYLLDRNGYEAEVLYARGCFSGKLGIWSHAVCIYKKDGKWWTCGDSRGAHPERKYGYYSMGPFKTIEDAARWTAGDYGLNWYTTKTHRSFTKMSEKVELVWPK